MQGINAVVYNNTKGFTIGKQNIKCYIIIGIAQFQFLDTSSTALFCGFKKCSYLISAAMQ